MKLQKKCSFLLAILISLLFFGCSSKSEKRIVIWSSNREFAPYVEFYNETHKDKVILVYKENPALSLPPTSSEIKPDIVIGSWLRNDKTKRYFEPCDFLFTRKYLNSHSFYKPLLKAGEFAYRQYLIPVSFNLPIVIFSSDNEKFVKSEYLINLEQIKKMGLEFNEKNKKGDFVKMGFCPQSSDDFLYLAAKIRGGDFRENKNNLFLWNDENLKSTVNYLKNWIESSNGSAQIENDFVYKYLMQADYKRVTIGKTLFAYTTSENLFKLSEKQLEKLDFRWVEIDKNIPVEDSMIMAGISHWSKNKAGAAKFISWFYKLETQRTLLERSMQMHLKNTTFGIADGFSALREVNEYVLPVYYTALLSNIPEADMFKVFEKKPAQWEQLKRQIVIPYIKDSILDTGEKRILTIEERFRDWKKQLY